MVVQVHGNTGNQEPLRKRVDTGQRWTQWILGERSGEILPSFTLAMLAALLSVLPDDSAAQQQTEEVVIAPVSTHGEPGEIT